MNRQLTLSVLFLSSLLASGLSYAEANHEQRAQHLQQALQLTPEQSANMKQVMEKHKPAFQAHHEEGKKLRAARDQDLAAVLNPEQMEKFKRMRPQHKRPDMKEGGHHSERVMH